jgi:Spy/CpxP family protein refolding chaperone
MRIRTLLTILSLLAVTFTSSAAFAQRGEVLRELVPPPRMLLKHQEALELTDAQKSQLKKLIKDAHDRSLDLEIEVQEEAEKLAEMLASSKVDLSAAMKQADRLMKAEHALKKVRLEMLIKTKNLLSKKQLDQIEEFRKKQREKKRGGRFRKRQFR